MNFARPAIRFSWPASRAFLITAALFAVLCSAWLFLGLRGDKSFWDARTYVLALRMLQIGHNPYEVHAASNLSALSFMYPPIFLKVASHLEIFFPGRSGWFVYLGLVGCSAVAIPWMLGARYLNCAWLTPAIAMVLFTFEPRLMGEMVLLSGNIGTVFYASALAAGIPGLRRNRWELFYVVVILASLVKPTFLALLLLPFFLGRRQQTGCALSILVVAIGYGAQRVWMPGMFQDFRSAMHEQLIVRHDFGFGVFSYLLKLGRWLPFMHSGALAVHFLLVGSMIAGLLFIRRSGRHKNVVSLWVSAVVLLAILASPRIQPYDADVAMLPAICICVEVLRPALRRRQGTLLIAGALACFAAVLSREPLGAVCLLLSGSLVLAIVHLLGMTPSAVGLPAEEISETPTKLTLSA